MRSESLRMWGWLKRTLNLLLVATIALSCSHSHAQEPSHTASPSSFHQSDPIDRRWQIEGFAAGGFVPMFEVSQPGNESLGRRFRVRLDFYNAGFQMGRMITAAHGPGIVHGRGELAIEVVPFWLATYPAQTITVFSVPNVQAPDHVTFPNFRRYGVSVTPLLFRWNFIKEEASHRSPWAQLGGGLLWTNHKFPVIPFTTSNTSVINFTPQVGIGENFFLRGNQSLDFALKFIHISNASLGDRNPGLNVTLQFSAGYSWWK